ncbi:hypothetical protein [uncultured Roseovarius sp.]|uniref:hypothetical protein n=1 Tax=uncultured Roseovarius sp. TaxID=293344 RepID=UPI002617AD0D|nr:hypothetical protein [uncultured Roseovarius sp.]
MSDPVTNVEIEDVLSSIRRLVSNGQVERDGEASTDDPSAGADRLVLTPSLRVDGTRVAGINAGDVKEPPLQPGPEIDADAEDQDPSQPQPEARSEETGPRSPDRPESVGEADPFDQTMDELTGNEEHEPEVSSEPEPHGGLHTQAAEFETAIAGRDDQWEPDGESEDDYAGGPVNTLNWQDHNEEPEEEELSSDPDWTEADEAVSERHAQAWQHEETHDSERQHVSDDTGDSSDAMVFDDAIMDEDTLRDMVSEIVRQELQGALGERITRNVRKLVRREIHRALTSQEFD